MKHSVGCNEMPRPQKVKVASKCILFRVFAFLKYLTKTTIQKVRVAMQFIDCYLSSNQVITPGTIRKSLFFHDKFEKSFNNQATCKRV